MQYVNECQGWQVGQTVQVREWSGQWQIRQIIEYGNKFTNVTMDKLKRDGTRSKYNSTTDIKNLMQLDAAQPTTDKNGLTAKEYAEQIFASGYAIHDYCRTTRQSLVKVLSISKTGRVKVQRLIVKRGTVARMEQFGEGTRPSQEESLIKWDQLETKPTGEPETYTPRLYNSEWKYWNGEEYIQYAGMKLTWLLD